MFSVKDKIVFITGVSRGIGRAIARGFVEHGAIVYGSIRNEQYKDELLKENIYPVIYDVRNFQVAEKTLLPIYEKEGRIDCLINNAGISSNTPASLFKEEEVRKIIETNFEGAFFLCQTYYKLQKKYKIKQGNIINIASILGLVGTMLASIYSGTKGAVLQLTKSLAIEWANSNFRVNAICPGFIETDMTENMQKREELKNKILENIPLKRLGKPEDIVGAALFLASDYSSYMTGQYIVIDGGLTCQ
ncbi:MAG: short-chain dehydrogenase [Leptospiraceae bacterium]|nr:MAG: short-chain dehydrogenase [Leptospiraceae bacterium]